MHSFSSAGRRVGLSLLVLGLGFGFARAQDLFPQLEPAKKPANADRIEFTVQVVPADPFSDANRVGARLKDVRRGELLRLTITGKPKAGAHTYPLTQRTEGQDVSGLCSLQYEPSDAFQPLWPVKESPPKFVNEGAEGGWLLEHKAPFTWTQDVLVKPDARPGPATLRFTIRAQACDKSSCVWGDHVKEVSLNVLPDPPEPVSADVQARLKVTSPPPPKVVPVPPDASGSDPEEDAGVQAPKSGGSGLWGFILQGILWGAISLVTPCVFPMIPITVSFFLHEAEKEHHRPLLNAAVYCGTIVVVLTTSAVALLSVFQQISTHALTNYFMGALFIFFALSLFGMYDIELPSSLASFTSKREGQGGLVGTMFMALTFTIISFACVAPFLGGFGGTATAGGSQLSWAHRILGGLAFSATFASPFFVLALFPSLLRKLPKSGSWLNSVKVVMGFLELAAALAFFRSGERTWLSEPNWFTFDFVLALYVAIAVLCGLYLLNVYRLPHDTPLENLGVLRMTFGLAFLALAVYLAPGLLKSYDAQKNQWRSQRPSGVVFAWVESFLLPDFTSELTWHRTLEQGLAEARQKNQLVFLDFTGVTCKNCAYNESNVFTKRDVNELLQKYVRVQLYTDRVPNKLYTPEELAGPQGSVAEQTREALANRAFQASQFGDARLPLYVILRPLPDGKYKEVARYDEGKINDPAAFAAFLRKPLRR
jgi:thiol:disulfide interchange protein DsbD